MELSYLIQYESKYENFKHENFKHENFKNDEYFNLLNYILILKNLIITFESDFNKLLYDELLKNNHIFQNIPTNEQIEFIQEYPHIFNKQLYGKCLCEITLNNNLKQIPNIKFTFIDKPKKYLSNEEIRKQFPNIYNQIILYWNNNIIKLKTLNQIIELEEKISSIKKYLSENFIINSNEFVRVI